MYTLLGIAITILGILEVSAVVNVFDWVWTYDLAIIVTGIAIIATRK